jgi:hypothetical protein
MDFLGSIVGILVGVAVFIFFFGLAGVRASPKGKKGEAILDMIIQYFKTIGGLVVFVIVASLLLWIVFGLR